MTVTLDHACPFCKLRESNRVVASNDFALAIWDGYPISPGHALIIPHRHLSSFFETSAQERQAVLSMLDQMKREIDKLHQPDAYNVGVNDGQAAGQTVNHLHIHLIPRYKGDVPDPRGGVRWLIPEKANYWSHCDD